MLKNILARPYLALFILTLLTAGGSIFYLSYIASQSDGPGKAFPAPPNTMSFEYATLAKNMVEQRVFSEEVAPPYTPDTWRTPGYPAFLVPFYVLFDSFYPALFAQLGVLFATVILIFLMARKMLGELWAFALSVLYLLLPTTILSASTLLTETLFTFFFVAALYLCFFYHSFSLDRGLYLRWGLAGMLLAISTYIRPASLYIIPFFLFAYFAFYLKWSEISRRQIIAAMLLVLMFAATLLPWFIRNERVAGHFAFASTGAFVLFRQNATQFYENYYDIPNIEARYVLLERAGFPPGSVPKSFEASAALKDVAVDVITEHPFAYTLFHVSSFIPFFTSSGAQNYWFFVQTLKPAFDPAPEPSLVQALNPFSLPTLIIVLKNHGWTLVENAFWGVMTLAMFVGLWYPRNRRVAWTLFTLIFYFALATGPIAHARYRMPVEPLILLISFSALASLYDTYKHKNDFKTLQAPT